MNGSGASFYPAIYAFGAAVALGGGIFAMLFRQMMVAGLAASMTGVGIVVAAVLVQALHRPGQQKDCG
ncbi:MAG: hypothetical protein Q8R02_16780 [Hyphomonadaceae bacterium]|nr:hypothetical protein [Hyphomonadaceae bacterium]